MEESQAPTTDRSKSDSSTGVNPVRIRSPSDLAAELAAFIAPCPEIIGGVDILNIDCFHPLERAGIFAAVLAHLMTVDGIRVAPAIVIIIPPESDVDAAHNRAWHAGQSTFLALGCREMYDDVQDRFKSRFKVISVVDLRIQSVLSMITAQSENTAVIVTDAANYRDQNVDPYIVPGSATPLLPQDFWVPQLHALATAAADVAQERRLYIGLDTGQLSPSRPRLHDLLLSIDGCGVMGSSEAHDFSNILVKRIACWDQWIRDGYLGKVLREIEELPQIFGAQKPFLRIQMFHKAGLFGESLRAIREEIVLGSEMDVSMVVKLAHIAQDANASKLASDVLSPIIDHLYTLKDLESALATAQKCGYGELEERVAARLATMFPASRRLQARKRRIMSAARDYSGIAGMAARQGDEANAEYFGRLAQFFAGTETPDYFGIIASAGGDTDLAEDFRMACVKDALHRRLIVHAMDLALPIPDTPRQSKRGELLLLEVLEAVLLWSAKVVLPDSDERIETILLALVERLAADPTNQELRFRLIDVVQPAMSGLGGLALVASVVINLASRPITLSHGKSPSSAAMIWLVQHKEFLNAALGWLRDQQPVVIGRLVMPKALLTEPADEVVSAITEYLNFAPVADEDDVAVLQQYLALAAAITPHCTDPDFDLQLMRLVGSKFAISGYAQVARDLAEQTLLNSATSPRRRRLGWFAMAEVYHRCHNHLEGLIALACSLAADHAADEEHVWYEANLLARFFRDCGLYTLARTAIGKSRQQLNQMGLTEKYGHRLDTMEIQIRQHELSGIVVSSAELEALTECALTNAMVILARGDETAPAAALVGQLLNIGRKRGTMKPPNAEEIFAQLCERAGGNIASFAAIFSADSISATELFSLVKLSAAARYSDDVGYDMRDVAIMAGRALADDLYIQNSVETSFALELIADHGVAVPGWDEAAKPPAAPERVEQPAEIARSLSLKGLSVVQIGFDSNGRLVRLSTVGGHLQTPVREPAEIINEESFNAWAAEFPYRYGIDESSANLFYTTTADLTLSDLPGGPIVVVADATLQPFPPNIFFLGDNFSGRTRPMAAAPSLAWLNSAQQKSASGDGRFCSWISTAVGGSEGTTLQMLAERLEPTFIEHGFKVDNGPTLPEELAGSTMVIITAHGGIHPEGRFFQVVSDEGILRVTPGTLAGALRNVGTVVLFVCSGGRSDKHPGAHTTLGLAKMILDRGCQAVIASPWPLDSRVPSHWLPVFLKHWSGGEPLIQANFMANQFVDQYFSLDPARGLAMTLFGNPMVRRP